LHDRGRSQLAGLAVCPPAGSGPVDLLLPIELESLRDANADLTQRVERSYQVAKLLLWECNGAGSRWFTSSEAVSEFFGKVPKSYRELLAVVHKDDIERVLDVYNNGRGTDSSFAIDYRVITSDGDIRQSRAPG